MTTHVLRGTKREIADNLIRIPGEVREAIVFVDEPDATTPNADAVEDIFAEMQPFVAGDIADVNDSRQAIYTR